MTAVFLCVLLHCFTPCPFWRKKQSEGGKKTFHLLIRWSYQQSIEMRLSLLQQIEWPKKEHGGSKSKESLIWSCEWQYWFAFSFLTGQDSDSESKVMGSITVTTCCFSGLSSLFLSLSVPTFSSSLVWYFFDSTFIFVKRRECIARVRFRNCLISCVMCGVCVWNRERK